MSLLEKGRQNDLIEAVINKAKKLEKVYDFTVIEGSDFIGADTAFEFETNVTIAKNFGAPVVIVISGESKSTSQIISSALTAYRNFTDREVKVISIIVNKVAAKQIVDVQEFLTEQLPDSVSLSIISENKNLHAPTMREVYEHLGGKEILGEDELIKQVQNFITGAMQVPQFLNHIKENVLKINDSRRLSKSIPMNIFVINSGSSSIKYQLF